MKIDLKKLNLSLAEAIRIALPNDELYLDDKVYNEKIVLYKPNITLIGQDNTVIVFNDSHATPIRHGNGGVYGTTGSSTLRVLEEANGFKAYNITFMNNYKREGRPNGQAVAFKSECSNIYIKDCKFIGHQDTLYVDGGTNNVIEDCYICGDIDFIFGSADCLFKNCHIHAVNDEKEEGFFTAPSTYIVNEKGFVFKDCVFSQDEMVMYLGRPWFPGGAKMEVYPRISFINCKIDESINLSMKKMHEKDKTNYSFNLENCCIGVIE
jgi:pectinesterase